MIFETIFIGFTFATVIFALTVRLTYQPIHPHPSNKLKFSFFSSISNWSSINYNNLFLTIIGIVAIAVRSWDFGVIPGGFNQDGAMAAVDAKALADYGTDRLGMSLPVHFTAWGYGQMSVLLSYLMVPFIKIGGLNEVTARLPLLIISLFGLLALYGFIKDSFDRTTALVVLFLAAINPWHIMQSRWALDCNLFPHFFIIGCYFLNKGKDRRYNLYISMLAFSLCMYSYGIAFLTVPIFLFSVALYALMRRIFHFKDIIISIFIYSFLSAPIWLVMIINYLKLPTIQFLSITMPFFSESVRSGDILFFSSDLWTQLGTNYNSLLNTVILQNPDAPWNALDKFGTQYLFSLPFVALGLAYLITKVMFNQNESNINSTIKFGPFIILVGLGIGLWTGIVIASVNVNRINIIYYFMIIFAGLGLTLTLRWFRSGFIISGLIYVSFFCLFCNYYFNIWSKEIGKYFFEGMGKALQQANKINPPRYYITVNSQYNGSKNVSEILTLFHHKVDARYFQGKSTLQSNENIGLATPSLSQSEIPYLQRYRYINPGDMIIDAEENAVYVVNSQEKRFFDENRFTFIDFDGFTLITPQNQ